MKFSELTLEKISKKKKEKRKRIKIKYTLLKNVKHDKIFTEKLL